MKPKSERFWSLKTRKSCLRMLLILLCGILLFSLLGAVISSDGMQVKISHLKIDARGAELDMDLYAPRGVSDTDQLPCVILAHGRGATKNVARGFAEELSRRGYVVLNVNAYGMGLSEQPARDEGGNGVDGFSFGNGPFGLYDAVNFARTLTYVDATRIALLGHSFGSSRSSATAVMDAGYYTLNDQLINILADTFGQSFTEAEIAQDADELAAQRLNADQMTYYEALRDETVETYNTRVNTIILTGASGGPAPAEVEVAGHTVTRECQVNVTVIAGMYDSLGPGATWLEDGTTTAMGEPYKKQDTWYAISTDGQTYTELGGLTDISTDDTPALAEALASRTARITCYNPESHSKQYFSSATNADAVRILEQAFGYNNGELADPATQPIDAAQNIWWLRAVCNLCAMLCMIAALFPLTGLLLSTPFFQSCRLPEGKPAAPAWGKAMGWVFSAAAVVITVVALYQANLGGPVWAGMQKRILPNVFRLVTTSAIADWFVVWLAGGSALLLAVKMLYTKRKTGQWGLARYNLRTPLKPFGKTLLIGVLCILFANTALVMIERLFNQDFRFWQMMFTEMKIEHWLVVALPYVVLFFVLYLVLGLAVNYGIDDSRTGARETIVTIVVNSLGVWGLCLFCYVMWFINWQGAAISDFTLSYSMLLFVPVTVYISRKMYKLPHGLWLGALGNACLLAWSLVSSAGMADSYYGQGILSVLFGV